MTTTSKSERRAGEGVRALCSHLVADPRGAKVRLPDGELVCFTCYLDGVFNPPPPPLEMPYGVRRLWVPVEDEALAAMFEFGCDDEIIGIALNRTDQSVKYRRDVLRLKRR